MAKIFQVGVIGYGLSAKVFHIPFIQATPQLALRAIVQRSASTAKADHPEATVYADSDALLADASVDVVVLSTPPTTHFDLASKALKAGKHVVVEKPFAPTSAECDALIALAREHKVLLSVFQNRRWDSDFLTLQKVVASGALGRVVELETHFDRFSANPPRAWKALTAPGGGVAYDLGTHLIDQVLVLYGLPARVTGFLATQRPPEISPAGAPPDACTILLHYDSGLLVTVKASAVSAETEQLRFWARGDKGAFRKSHLDPQEPQIIGGMKLNDPQFGVEAKDHAGALTVYQDGHLVKSTVPTETPATYAKYYSLLAAALEGKGAVPVTAESSRDVIRLVELAIQSAKEGKTLSVN